MSKSVKKRSASNIYYGTNASSGALLHISEVPGGQKCNCNCVACGQPLEAKKGEQRRHHFAHVSNYECMYSSEISIYKALAVVLEREGKLTTPPVLLSFPAWREPDLVQPATNVCFDATEFKCEHLAYPPDLFITSHGSRLRILLDFNRYYDDQDKRKVFEQEAREQGYSCLMYHVPSIGQDDAFGYEYLQKLLVSEENAEWIFNRVEDKWRNRFYSVAEEIVSHGLGYECYIHANCYKGKYLSRKVDCAHCRFNVAMLPGCLCTARAGIQRIADFAVDHKVRMDRIASLRRQNEKKCIERKRKKTGTRSPMLSPRYFSSQHRDAPEIPVAPSESELQAEQQRIATIFDPNSTEQTVDKFNRRWIQCECCGRVLQTTEMASYGGGDSINRGLCLICLRNNAL